MQPQRYFRLHVGQLFLNQLIGGQRPPELLAVQYILASGMPAELSSAHHAPANTVARAVQTPERAR